VDLTDFEYRPANKSFDGQNVCCLHVGRLVEKKAPIDLVKAFKHAVESTKDNISLNLKIAGDGPLRSDLERKVQSLGLKGHVSVLGAVPHSQVSNLLSESNVYTQHCKTASDGDQEGQGVSFVEAAASGLPIISTRHNGLPDVILDGRTGYLVEEGDTKAMGEMIAQLAESPDEWRRLGKNGRRHIEENFDLRKQVSKMKDTISHFA
jgi:glycosyltransferase involved in cell wall biosynthesis